MEPLSCMGGEGEGDGDGECEGDGEGDIDVINMTCKKQDYLSHIVD